LYFTIVRIRRYGWSPQFASQSASVAYGPLASGTHVPAGGVRVNTHEYRVGAQYVWHAASESKVPVGSG